MNTAHQWQDSLADWGATHCARYPGETFDDDQPQPAEACTEIGAEDQSVSADAEVAIWLLKGLGVLFGVMFCVWVIVRYGHAF